jgi:type VI secretion system secreted protein Hcp
MAVSDYFLKVEGIDGESEDSKHKGEIDVLSWAWGETQSGTHHVGGGGGAGKVAIQDFSFVMKVNKASPKLMQACASGEHIKKAVLACRKAGKEQQEFLKVTMSDVLVSSYQTAGAGGADIIPSDHISLNFAKIEFEYKEQKADGTSGGTVKGGWNIKENKAA